MTRFKEAREKAGFTQKEAAINLDVSVQAVSYWETGNRTPSIEKIVQMCDLYNVTADYLLGRTPVPVTIVKEAPPAEPPPGMKRLKLDFGSSTTDPSAKEPDSFEQRVAEILEKELKKRGL